MSRYKNDMELVNQEPNEKPAKEPGRKKERTNIPGSPREFPTRPTPNPPERIPERKDPFENPSEIPLPPKGPKKRELMKRALLAALIGPGLVSCSNMQTNKLDKTKSLTENLEVLERIHKEAQVSHAPILAPNLYVEGTEKLETIREQINAKEAPDYGEVFNALNDGLYVLNKADKIADKRFRAHQELVERRHMVLDEGVKDTSLFYDHFKEIDENLREELAGHNRELAPAKANIFKERYKALHAEIVIDRELGLVKNTMKRMRQMDMNDQLPQTYGELSESLELAEEKIGEKPEDPSFYKPYLENTFWLAVKSSELTEIIRSIKGPTTETAALVIWKQRKKISKLNEDKADLSWSLSMASGMMDAMAATMVTKQAQVEALRSEVAVKIMAKRIRSTLPDKEVEVLAQGDKVIVKFQQLAYGLNETELPKKSKKQIDKVANIVKSSDAEKVVVKGHTDTIGSANENYKVATMRAKNVKSILENKLQGTPVQTKAVSYNEPIRPNMNDRNRMVNRRVDLVIHN
jgi:outer membrane protein OmpA-like peptidoglycan-associated protein